MLSPRPAPPVDTPHDVDALFSTHAIASIRAVEAATRRDIDSKKEELRQLVGMSYRNLIDSADSILLMKSSCESISANLSHIDSALRSLSPSTPAATASNPARVYGTATRVKYLVDTPENIWGCLDESMLLEAACRYLRANVIHGLISSDPDVLTKFPLLLHQWLRRFKSHERLTEHQLPVAAYADALAAAATIDHLNPKQISEMLMFYKAVLESPPGTQLFGGIPNPEEEVRLSKDHCEKLEGVMVHLESDYIVDACSSWLKGCCEEIFGELSIGKHLIDAIGSGESLGYAEKLVREALDARGSWRRVWSYVLRHNIFCHGITYFSHQGSPWATKLLDA